MVRRPRRRLPDYIENPIAIWTAARLTCALLGVLGVWLLWRAGIRLLGRPTAFIAAAVLTFCFLAVFYSHQALNDVPTLAPICLSLWGTAGLLIGDRAATGCSPVPASVWPARPSTPAASCCSRCSPSHCTGGAPTASPRLPRPALGRLAATVLFIVANPYALLTPGDFIDDLIHQQTASGDEVGKLGLTETNGWKYYLTASGWGIGWIPSLLAVAGAGYLFVRDRTRFWVLVPAPVVYILFMGSQVRFFGRWLLPISPFVALLAGVGALAIATWVLRSPVKARRPAALAVLFVIVCAQGMVYSTHSTLLLGRDDTRTQARDWMFENVPPGVKIVLEPIVPSSWIQPIGKNEKQGRFGGDQWVKYPVGKSQIDPKTGAFTPDGKAVLVSVEDFERVLRPDLINTYARGGFCLVVVGSTQRDALRPSRSRCPTRCATTATWRPTARWSRGSRRSTTRRTPCPSRSTGASSTSRSSTSGPARRSRSTGSAGSAAAMATDRSPRSSHRRGSGDRQGGLARGVHQAERYPGLRRDRQRPGRRCEQRDAGRAERRARAHHAVGPAAGHRRPRRSTSWSVGLTPSRQGP